MNESAELSLRANWAQYIQAKDDDVKAIHDVLQTTIRTVYPKYYPQEVVDFFCDLHSLEHVKEGIASGYMDASSTSMAV